MKSNILQNSVTKTAQLIAVFILSSTSSMAAVYTYIGNNYDGFFPATSDNPYDSSMRLKITFTTDKLLTDFAGDAEELVTSFTISDGINVLTEAATGLSNRRFNLVTDSLGNIVEWDISREDGMIGSLGDQEIQMSSMYIVGGSEADRANYHECVAAPFGNCSAIDSYYTGTDNNRGSWTVSEFPDPAIAIEITDGSPQECGRHGGKDVSMNASVSISGNDAIQSITWLLNGESVASGDLVKIFVPLGTNDVEANLETVLGSNATDTASITVEDTLPPMINTAFRDSKTEAIITSVERRGNIEVTIEVTDACDSTPIATSGLGIPIQNLDVVGIKSNKKDSSVSLTSSPNTNNAVLNVLATDGSGNTSGKTVALPVTP